MKRFLLLLFVVGIIVPCMAFPWCDNQDIFFWNASSDISGYRIIDHVPEIQSQKTLSVTVSSGTGELILGTWATPAGNPGVTTIAPGLWRFRTYARATAESGITTLKFYAINRSASGIETNLFYGNAITQDINAGPTPTEYLTSYARRNVTTFFPGDRLVIRVNGSATTSGIRTIYMDVAGNTNASMVSVSTFVCNDVEDSGAGAIGLAAGIIGGLIGAIILSRRKT